MALLVILSICTIIVFFSYGKGAILGVPIVGLLLFGFICLLIHGGLRLPTEYSKEEIAMMTAELESYEKSSKEEGLHSSFYTEVNKKTEKLKTELNPEVWEERRLEEVEDAEFTHFNWPWYNAIMLIGFFIFIINPIVFNYFTYPRGAVKSKIDKLKEAKKANYKAHEIHPLIGGWEEGDELELKKNLYGTYTFVSFRQDEIFYKNREEVNSVKPHEVKRNKTFEQERLDKYIIEQEEKDYYVTQQREFTKEHLV